MNFGFKFSNFLKINNISKQLIKKKQFVSIHHFGYVKPRAKKKTQGQKKGETKAPLFFLSKERAKKNEKKKPTTKKGRKRKDPF